MKHYLATAAFLLTFPAIAFAADHQFERTVNVGSQPDLYLSTGSGNITIAAGNGRQIKVVGHVHAGWAAFSNVKERVDRIIANPPITQNGNEVRIGDSNDRALFDNISVDYEVSVPVETALNLHSGSGDIVIEHVGRYLSATCGSGNLSAHGVHGAAELGTGSGDVVLEEDGIGNIKVKTGSGNIKVSGLDGGITTRSGSGDTIASGRLTGPANLSSGSGNIRLHLTPDARLNLQAYTGSGNLHIGYSGAPKQGENSHHHLTAAINGGGLPLEVHTGSGDIEVDSQ